MYSRDYILRLIERFGQALIAIRNRILQRKGDSATVVAEINEVAREAGLDLGIARQLDPASLLMWLSPAGDHDPARLWLLAELLYLAGLLTEGDERGGGRADFLRARALFLQVPAEWKPPGELVSASERAAELEARLNAPSEA